MLYKTIVLGSGGYKGYAILGLLHYFYLKNNLKNVKTYIGTSVGSIISLLLLFGYSPCQILKSSIDINLMEYNDLNYVSDMSKGLGLLSISKLRRIIEDLVISKVNKIPTLQGLKDMGYNFTAVTTNAYSGEIVYLNHDIFPELSCVEAVLMSSSVPLIFPKYEYKGKFYIDGASTNPFPISYVNNKVDDILGIVLFTKLNKDDSLSTYVNNLILMVTNQLQNYQCDNLSPNCHVIKLEVTDISLLKKNSKDGKFSLFLLGFKKGIEEKCQNI